MRRNGNDKLEKMNNRKITEKNITEKITITKNNRKKLKRITKKVETMGKKNNSNNRK